MTGVKDLPDSELVSLALTGDGEAREEIIDRCKDVTSYAVQKYSALSWRNLKPQDIEDLISECHVIVLESIELYNPNKGSGFPNFVKFIIRSKIVDFLRRRTRENKLFDYAVDTSLLDKGIEPTEKLEDRLNIKSLTEREKEIIALILTGESQTDVAKRFGVTKAMIGKILRKCVR